MSLCVGICSHFFGRYFEEIKYIIFGKNTVNYNNAVKTTR
jgi:hypothetical protein